MKIRTEKGITLIALIITIIVMLILVGVTVTVTLNGGLFEKAKDAANRTEIAREEEKKQEAATILIEYYNEKAKGTTNAESMEEYVLEKHELQIGDKVDYNPGTGLAYTTDATKGAGGSYTSGALTEATYTTATSTQEGTEWRVLGVNNNGQIELVSTKITSTTITLYGKQGYINAESILNGFCNNLYGKGNGAESARSLTLEDVNKLSGYNQTNTQNYGQEIAYKYMNGFAGAGIYYVDAENADDPEIQWFYTGGSSIWTPEDTLGAEDLESGKILKIPSWRPSDAATNIDITTRYNEDFKYFFTYSSGIHYFYASKVVFAQNGDVSKCMILSAEDGDKSTVKGAMEYAASDAVRPVVTLKSSVTFTDADNNDIFEINL